MSYSLRSLDSFGSVAAEDDSILDYFLTTDAVGDLTENKAFLVLGRKGSGKTALVRHFSEGFEGTLARPLSLRGYPWAIHGARVDSGASPIEIYVSTWRYLIVAQLASLVLSAADSDSSNEAKALRQYFNDNYGVINPPLDVLLRPKSLKLSRLSFEPTVLGNKLGGVALERSSTDFGLGVELNALSETLLEATVRLAESRSLPPLTLHFDELDQGLATLDEQRKTMLIGLILAARSVRQETSSSDCTINPIVYLRTDLWDDLAFSDKNKISQTLALRLEWDATTLKSLVDTRLEAKLGPRASWETVSAPALMRGSQSKWNHILARTFLRPRDVIKFLNAALEKARGRPDDPLLFDNTDIVSARDGYSAYLKAELDDEILAHWAHWEDALRVFSNLATVTFDREAFAREYTNRRSSGNRIDSDEALSLLHAFSVIGYERRSGYGGSSWAFQYSDPQAGWDQTASRFKVHPGLKEYARLREERDRGESAE
jgi:hypothetical protein